MNIRDRLLHAILTRILPYRDITKDVDGKKELYLRRYFIRRSGDKKVFLHFFARSDDDPDLHDHPWAFTSYILLGGYDEETFTLGDARDRNELVSILKLGWGHAPLTFNTEKRRVRPLTKNVRQASHAHRVLLRGKPCWSIVIAGPRTRTWGFVKPDNTWIEWRTYLGLPATTPDQPEDL